MLQNTGYMMYIFKHSFEVKIHCIRYIIKFTINMRLKLLFIIVVGSNKGYPYNEL